MTKPIEYNTPSDMTTEEKIIQAAKEYVWNDPNLIGRQNRIARAAFESGAKYFAALCLEQREKEPEWIVNDNAELGVKIDNRFYFLYKGGNIQYESGKHDNGMPMYYRPVWKREFGECCHPIHLEIMPDQYREGEGWQPLPATAASKEGER